MLEQYLQTTCRDPETLYYTARQFAYFGEHARALEVLRDLIDLGYVCFPTMARDPWLDPLRGKPDFSAMLRGAEIRHREAAQVFLEARGGRILGMQPAQT
jgi:hypothetical protein